LALLLRQQYEFPQCGINKGNIYFYYFIYYMECSWRLADVLAYSQKVSHPEMKLVSAAIGA
jgi:hypothetical protein